MMPLRATGKEGTKQGERGFTLIEVMFAVVYLAIGLLGIAAMQDTAIARNTDARRMNYATNLAAEMIERVRWNSPANSTPLLGGGYVYSGIQACSNTGGATCPGGETAGNAIAANNATASGDYDQWRARLKATDTAGNLLLPNAIGKVTSMAIGPAAMQQVQITVTIQYTSGLRVPTATMNTFVAPL